MLASLRARFETADPIDVGARMVFALFLLSTWVTSDDWFFKLPLQALAIAALVLPPLHRDWRLWALFALVLCARTIRHWFTQDNHVFLLTWFAVAMALSLRDVDPLRAVRVNGRLLIGLSFLFAALWKGPLSSEFLDGTYYSYTFLSDKRFHATARIAGGVPEETLRENYARPEGGLAGATPRVRLVAKMAAWWTFAIETALALAFLWPRLHRARHALLLLFGATTYLVVDIETYGWSLMAIGAAQTEPERPLARGLYLAAGVLILAYDAVLTGP